MESFNLMDEIYSLPRMTADEFYEYVKLSFNTENNLYEFAVGLNSYVTGNMIEFHEEKQTFSLYHFFDLVGEISILDLDKYPIHSENVSYNSQYH